MNLLDTLKEYGDDSLGYPTKKTRDRMYKLNPNLDEDLETLMTTVFKSTLAPLLHEEVEKHHWKPIPEQYVKYMQAMIANRYSKQKSIKETIPLLEALGFKVTSNGQLGNIWNRMETKLNLKDKERTKTKDARERVKKANAEGKARNTPYTKERKKQLDAARRIAMDKAELARLKKEEALVKKRLGNAARKQGLTASELAKPNKQREEEQTAAQGQLEKSKVAAKATGKKVLYEPTPKQAEFHSADEDIVLYGGAAGGGKSYAMLVDALRYCQEEDYRGLIIRRTSPMLKELIGVSRSLYPKAFPGAKYNKAENMWYFPSGATIQFGYLDKPEDLDNYQGLPYSYIGFDEIQHQRSDEGFTYLMSRLRSANPNIKCYIRASANPGGAPWVKETFIDPAEPNTTFYKNGISYRFIPANLADNPHLDTPQGDETISPYRKMLMALPEVKRKQLLEGDWTAGEDSMFAFTPMIHVTDELPPMHWNVINSLDYGYTDPAAALWGAIDPTTGALWVYQELEVIGAVHEEWARQVKETEGYLPQGVERVIDHSVFNATGHTGPGVREKIARFGLLPKPADRNREAGWNQIHERLIVDPVTGKPNLYVHSSCVKLIDQILAARRNEKKPDDIDEKRIKTKGRQHHWDLLDTLRYMCMARPQKMTVQERSMNYKNQAQGFNRAYGYFN